ncbi:hypothetical protein WN944_017529 [Citrus x changshan-huyou]|uniref:SKP1-like protein 21 n=1 Tax=Citrus x changshan-huyou TaxID=2935761 RepID=A0AAP0MD13_9ROSI
MQERPLSVLLLVVQVYCLMSEVDMAVIKPEMMKSYIWLQTADGSIQQVEQEVAMFCPLICQEVIQKGMGSSKNYAISLPQRVNPAMLSLILDYCRFHQVPGSSNKERKSFDEKFIRMDTKRLCELTSAADSLQLKPLVDLTSRALARIIEGKTPEEIREIFHLPDDLTEEEKLEPLKNTTDDPRIRLLNRLYAKKRKELKEREKLKNVESEEERVDERSVDDLLQFINGGERDSKGTKSSKNKKKNQRKKDQLKDTCPIESIKTDKQESNGLNFVCHSTEVGNKFSTDLGETSNMQNMEDGIFARKVDFDDVDMDDEIDPALKEKLDREVEDFARRLNSDWPERMQEILSLGHDMKPLRHSTKGNGTIRRYATRSNTVQYDLEQQPFERLPSYPTLLTKCLQKGYVASRGAGIFVTLDPHHSGCVGCVGGMLKILIHCRLLNDGHSSIREYVYSLPDRASAKGTAAMRLVNSNECR